MRGSIFIVGAVSAATLLLVACGGGASPEQRSKLIELCKNNEAKAESCECQVDLMLKEGDPKVVAFMVAMADLEAKVKADPASADKVMEEAIKAAGFANQEEFGKAMEEMQTKLEPKIEACKK
jgi:hypothetical protein